MTSRAVVQFGHMTKTYRIAPTCWVNCEPHHICNPLHIHFHKHSLVNQPFSLWHHIWDWLNKTCWINSPKRPGQILQNVQTFLKFSSSTKLHAIQDKKTNKRQEKIQEKLRKLQEVMPSGECGGDPLRLAVQHLQATREKRRQLNAYHQQGRQ